MDAAASKKVDSPRLLTVSDGGRAKEHRTHADVELERAVRALFYAMCGRDGKSINKNFRNIACGETHPVRMLIRRLKEAKAARNDAVNYPKAKETVRELDRYVDRLFNRDVVHEHTTGDYPRVA